MKALKKLVIGIVAAAVMMSSAATALADETTAPATTQETTGESTTSTIDISKMSFDTMYGNQIIDFLDHQYEYNGEKIPLAESNFYFLQTFIQLSQYAAYGYYPATTAGYLDLAATYGEGEEKKTYADYFVQQAEEYIHSTYIFVERAKAAGLKLSDEDKKSIDDEISAMIEQQAKPAGVSLDVILKLYFGPACDEKSYRAILENATLAGKYQEKYISEYKIPEDKLMVPSIRYALFNAPGASASDADKKKAETAANDLLKKCKTIEDLKTNAEAGKKDGTIYDEGTLSVPKGKLVSSFEEWAYDASRKEGEMGIIYVDDYGYFVVGYLGKVKLDDDEKQSLASDAMNTEIENEMKANKHNFHTDQKFGPAKAAPTAAPTPTTDPGETSQNGETAPTGLPTESGAEPADNGMSNVLIIVFVVIGGIAIIAVVIILVMNSKNAEEDGSSKKSSSKKASKKASEEDDEEEDEEDEESEEEYDEDEEEEPETQADPYSGISEDEEDEEEAEEEKPRKKKK